MKDYFFDSIPVVLPRRKIYSRLGYQERNIQISPEQKQKVEQYIDEAGRFIKLQGAAKILAVTNITPENISLEKGIIFASKSLANFLKGCSEIAVMAVTAGGKISREIDTETIQADFSRAVVFDACASEAVDSSLGWIMNYLNQQFLRQGKSLTRRRFSAGYADFSLENQKIIYDILGLSKLGIKINESFILIPEKSVTAVAGILEINNGE